ncbi:MAG: PilZ domain-containing protein [Candidatus Korobacteraceae bacterium]|jgi:hypothetical protein
MMRKKAKTPQTPDGDGAPRLDRRQFERVELPATAFALNVLGKDLGRVVEIGGGGLLLDPASPWARLSLVKGQQLVVTVVEPATGNQTDVGVEVRHIRAHRIGLRFL